MTRMRYADWIIDLGPEAWPGLDPGASDGGGEIVAAGPPEEIVREKRSYTGAFLKPVLARRGAGGKKKRVEAAE
jgi:excinuclease ABC subunit A